MSRKQPNPPPKKGSKPKPPPAPPMSTGVSSFNLKIKLAEDSTIKMDNKFIHGTEYRKGDIVKAHKHKQGYLALIYPIGNNIPCTRYFKKIEAEVINVS